MLHCSLKVNIRNLKNSSHVLLLWLVHLRNGQHTLLQMLELMMRSTAGEATVRLNVPLLPERETSEEVVQKQR